MGGKLAMKKVVSYILILTILISGIFCGDPVDVHAEATVNGFDLDVYRANEYLKKGSVCNKIIKSLMKDNNLPSQVIVKALDSKKFGRTVIEWELAHLADKSPVEIAQGELDKKGYYEAILFSIFISESKMDNSLFDMGKTVSAETNQILSSVKSWVKKTDEIGMDTICGNQKISKMTANQKKKLEKQMSDLFEKQHPLLVKSGEIAEIFNDVFAAADTVYDAINKMAYYTNACELSNQSKSLIQLMYKECPKSNLAMKEALRELEISLDGFNNGVKAEIQSVAIKQSADVLSALTDAGWEKVINANPYVSAFCFGGKIGTKIGDNICNTFFSTDKTIEQYEKMKCLGEFYDLLSSSAQKLGKTYVKKKTAENAQNYFAAIDALFAAAKLSCKFGTEYADVLYKDATLGWLGISEKSYSQFVSDIKSIKKTYVNEQKSLINNYLANLKADYPTIYKEMILGLVDKKSEQKGQDKPISAKAQKTWGKAYIKAMKDWEKQVKQWEKESNVQMPQNMKGRAEAALIQITNDNIPQLIYYYGSSVGVLQYVGGHVHAWGSVVWTENIKRDFYYAEKMERGYLSDIDMSSHMGERRKLYSFDKYGSNFIFEGTDYNGFCNIYPSTTQKVVKQVSVEEYYKKFNQLAGNVKFKKASDKVIPAREMKKKLGGR